MPRFSNRRPRRPMPGSLSSGPSSPNSANGTAFRPASSSVELYPAATSAAVIAPAEVPARPLGVTWRSCSAAKAPASPIPFTPPPSKTRSADCCPSAMCRDAIRSHAAGHRGLFALGLDGPVVRRVVVRRQLAAAFGSGNQLVRDRLLGDEARLHAEVDGLRMVGDDRQRRLLRLDRVAA